MITITVNNNRCQLGGDRLIMNKLYKAMKVKNPNAFHIRRYMQPGWDGCYDYIKQNGTFSTGLITQVVNLVHEYGSKVKFIDLRDSFVKRKEIDWSEYRDYQQEAIKAISNNYLESENKIWLPQGCIKAATNGGKTYIAAGLYKRFGKRNTLILINSKDLFEQLCRELPELVGENEVGIISSKKTQEGSITIGMAPTINARLASMKSYLASVEVLLVDECDLSDNKTYSNVLRQLYNAKVRVGLSGTLFEGKLAKYKMKHQNMRSFYGEKLYEISNKDLQDKKHSSRVVIKIVKGNEEIDTSWTFAEEYYHGIVKNKDRNIKILKRVKYAIRKNKIPLVVVVKRHEHLETLVKLFKKKLEQEVVGVHHKTTGRAEIIKRFREGEIPILISSMIIKRGLNLPFLITLINAGGGDDPANPLQLLGRVMRKHKDLRISVKYYEDFYDEGKYLRRHSKHRINYYREQKQTIKELYKK